MRYSGHSCVAFFEYRTGPRMAANVRPGRAHESASAASGMRDETDTAYNSAAASSSADFAAGVRFANYT